MQSHTYAGLFILVSVGVVGCKCSVPGTAAQGDDDDTASDGPSQITQRGITFHFDRGYTVGQYANGDYWVLGPVTLTNMEPAASRSRSTANQSLCTGFSAGINACTTWCASNAAGSVPVCDGQERGTGTCHCDHFRNGWEVNPLVTGGQGFDSRAGDVNASLIPDLPYTALPGQSIVKVASNPDTAEQDPRGCLRTAVVLTVVGQIPPGQGQDVFRPPYVGSTKPEIPVSTLRMDLLPVLAPVGTPPSLTSVAERFAPLQLDHKQGDTGRNLHPVENVPDYGSEIAVRNNDGILRLMLDDPPEQKRMALINVVQYGIDLYQMLLHGHVWGDGGGHRPGQRLPLVFASVILGDSAMQERVKQSLFFSEERTLQVTSVANGGNGMVLFGGDGSGEESYWNSIATGGGNRSQPDPYGYIDGGQTLPGPYQSCCLSQPWKGSVLAVHLMPSLRPVWNDEQVITYVDRWVNLGVWAQPDPCAPVDGTCSGGTTNGQPCSTAKPCGADSTCTYHWNNYGITFGSNGAGGCILDNDLSDGVGRFPHKHLQEANTGLRSSELVQAMWTAYRGPSCFDGVCTAGAETAASCPYDCAR